MLRPVFAELIPVAEEIGIESLKGKAEKAALPGPIVKEIVKEAEWNDVSKKALELSAPEVCAKLLNRTGVSAEHKDEIVLLTALGGILAGHMRLAKRLDTLIAMQEKAGNLPPKPTGPSPPAPAKP